MNSIKNYIVSYILNIGLVQSIIKLAKWCTVNITITVLSFIIVLFTANVIHTWYTDYIILYEQANSKKDESKKDEKPGLVFTQIDNNLYSLIGSVKEGDCDRIVPLMPDRFTVILESPGGSLAEGSCLAAHLKLRDVITVVRGDAVFNELGKEIYTPGTVNLDSENTQDHMKDKTMCASACGLILLGGDKRYLIGDVYFGIHGPRTPKAVINQMPPTALEAAAFRTASSLLKLLDRLGVDESLRLLFIQIPAASMYWLHPRDFAARPQLVTLATNYKDFWSYTASNAEAPLK